MKIFILVCLCFPLLALGARSSEDNLTLELARSRRELIKGVSYKIHFQFAKDAKGFEAREVISLELNRKPTQSLSLDSLVTKIITLKVNGREIKKYVARTGSLDLEASLLELKNTIEISYRSEYSQDSSGLIQAKDPEDKLEYIYTDFEPYYAHRLYPCFDQPDLKATYEVSVTVPQDWKVIHNELLESEAISGGSKTSIFKKTPKISTYLFFLGAGPFEEWTDSYNGLPIVLYARKSIAKYVDAVNIFATTKAGLKFYNDYFGYAYPFSKYGQVFIPEFAWGGMENPGAVTLNERNIFRGPVPTAKYEDRDNLILHEMAHMWFGDLVTMEWWNDLWLNESFATYLASVAQERALGSKGTWLDFYSTKAWGYWQDQLVTTHPIETDVPDVRTAKGNFDGITYAKGASALKQLHFFAGEEGFERGLKEYFKKFAFQNTQRADFINAIGTASKKDLSDWTKSWLQTSGPNTVEARFSCEHGDIKTFSVHQSKSSSGELSPHRMKLALFKIDDKKFELDRTIEVAYQAEETQVKELLGKDCPAFVMPNAQDYDYALFHLDGNSLSQVLQALTELPDSLSRFMLWNILSQEVRDARLAPVIFHQMSLKALAIEKDEFLLGFLLGRHSSLRDQYFMYLTKEQRAELAPTLEEVLWNRVKNEKWGSSLQLTFFDYFVSIAQSEKSQTMIFDMLRKGDAPQGITLDQDRRWAMILNLASNGHKGALALTKTEIKEDASTQGKKNEFVAQATFPETAQKVLVWKKFLGAKDLPYSHFKDAAERFHTSNHPEIAQRYLKKFFERVSSIDWKAQEAVVDIYFEKLFPFTLCSKEAAELSRASFKKARKLTSLARRSWLEAQDELDRCVRVRR
jgi:aminopeptidase N